MDTFRNIFISFTIAFCITYFLTSNDDITINFIKASNDFLSNHKELTLIVGALISFLSLLKIYKYGLTFQIYTSKNQSLFSHEFDVFYIGVISAFVSAIFLNINSFDINILYNEILTNFPLGIYLTFLFLYVICLGIPAKINDLPRFFIKVSSFFLLSVAYNIYNIDVMSSPSATVYVNDVILSPS